MKRGLKPEVAAKYNLVGVVPGHHNFAGYGEINLLTMDIALADQLAALKFPYLQLKKKPAKSAENAPE